MVRRTFGWAFATCLLLPLASVAATRGVVGLSLPSKVLERKGTVVATMRFQHAHTGKGSVHVRWTDSLNRVVQEYDSPIELTDEEEFTFPVDMTRAVAMENTLEAHFTMDEKTAKGTERLDETGRVDFTAKPLFQGWRDYVIIMYQSYPAPIHEKLERLGINGGQWVGRNQTTIPQNLLKNNIRWYSEQIATDFYAEYHRFRTDRSVDWSFQQAKDLYFADPTSKEALKRHPSLSDPVWLAKITDRLRATVKLNQPYRPFFYSLADETGIAELGAQWDFDFSDQSLEAMRIWLHERYGTLAALNAAWGSSFKDWNLVTPQTTNEAMKRTDENWTSWADFKEWMDIAYANAIKAGVDAVHEVDPEAYAGVVGAQKPGWGGYDYSRLTQVATVMEPYDIGGSVKLAHSLNPSIPLLSTTFASDDAERQRIWHELFQGNRGLILWDEDQRYIRPDGSKGEGGARAEGYYNELRDGLAALIIASKGDDDGIAVHFSQPSLRTQWMLERRPDGDAWMKRDASYERSHNDFLRLRESWGHAIEDQGLQYRFISYAQVEKGGLLHGGIKALILPNSSSLSAAEVSEIRNFIWRGGTVIADGLPGTYDEHSRRLAASPLADLFVAGNREITHTLKYGAGQAITVGFSVTPYLQNRLRSNEQPTARRIAEILHKAGVTPTIAVTDANRQPAVGVNVRTFENGGVTLLTLLSNPQLSVDELGAVNSRSNERFSKPQQLVVHLPSPMYVWDVRAKKDLGRVTSLPVTMAAYDPTVLAISNTPQPEMKSVMPDHVKAGDRLTLSITSLNTPSAKQIYHVDVIDPSGQRNVQYSTNVFGEHGAAAYTWPLAKNDAAGAWTFRVQEMLTGVVQTHTVQLQSGE
ncbi:alpha-amylase family protein [Terriglobus albidus]|uniref:alpha-amylase family protein n=1 Tax=Terriglobus albidus TaxID=1592106 RepID=UPI0021DFAE5F|nr:alpha-amylase family protein [Terriglobus albidus]